MISLIASVFFAAAAPAQEEPSVMEALSEKPVFSENATALEMINGCRSMIPADVEIRGHINRRSRRGTEIAAYRYILKRLNGKTELSIFDKNGKSVEFKKEGRLLDTDITWSDLTLDYLWWNDISFDAVKESETAQGIICRVLLLKNADRTVRVWIDKRTGAMLQAHELVNGEVKRELFCTSLKKFDDRWAPKNIEVGPPGAKYRTKIVVENVK
jgi:hypothetical protein